MKNLIVSKKMTHEMHNALVKSVAMYDLLHAHARGETDLTEDQLANAVTGIATDARRILARVRGHLPAPVPASRTSLSARARRWGSTARRRPKHLDS